MQMVDLDRLEQEADEALDEMALSEVSPEGTEVEQDQPTEEPKDTQAEDGTSTESEPTTDSTIEDENTQERSQLEVAEERVANAQQRMTQATQEAADLRKQNFELTEIVNQLRSASVQSPDNASNPQESGDLLQQLEGLATEYEDFAPLVNAIRTVQSQVGNLQQSAESSKQEAAVATANSARDKYMSEITSVHPDAETVAASPDFDAWLSTQPGFFRDNVYGTGQPNSAGTPEQVSYVISAYKSKQQASQPTSKLEEAKKLVTPSVRSQTHTDKPKPTFTQDQIANMSLAEYEANEEAIDAWLYG
jgi:hypothetical protein